MHILAVLELNQHLLSVVLIGPSLLESVIQVMLESNVTVFIIGTSEDQLVAYHNNNTIYIYIYYYGIFVIDQFDPIVQMVMFV